VRFLVDTSVFLEIILEQERAEEAKRFLSHPEKYGLFLSDYSLHSIGILLFRKNRHQAFRDFLDDVICNAGVQLLHLLPEDMGMVIDAASRFRLDFDDAYQYGVATKYNLPIVSFDTDFDRTERERKSPGELVSGSD
jgi:predicted nucleic acid-binding protein